ncbi:tRNA pseudouridine(13) synthase TruD [Legionella cardiaca]|uniref:tRNA pseudouridine synthase D n=1 Tax=Legionella cardiaca TaxID=1071983 RepID=A0ABY8ATB0_9GAMM|nr:tRNA pseudouridine(13) synthase TruD [Legionella cardiaca]WED43910.1 tRNA pseudouridine(13) synthase TruD [Legionella cardiaca]
MFDCSHFAFAYGAPAGSGKIKASPEDFRVNEILGFNLSGEGEHLYLQVEKKGLNTEELVKALARDLGRPAKTISYAGLKDKGAITTQWLSIHCPGEEINSPLLLQGEGWHVVQHQRHAKKLRTGALAANEFSLVIRNISDSEDVETRLQKIYRNGIPNYFGAQRFGYENQNLVKAEKLLLGGDKVRNHFLRGLYYSAARSFLFNQILSQRVQTETWNKAVAGDVMQLAGTNSIFAIDEPDEVIIKRVSEFDISPAAPLWGRGEERVSKQALIRQRQALSEYESWCDALEKHGLERSYRSLILKVENMKWDWQGNLLHLSFRLPSGSYATSVVRELMKELPHDTGV